MKTVKYIVRHYSHLYLADLVKVDVKYGYFHLTSIYKEYNNYVGDIVKKELALVRKIEVPPLEEPSKWQKIVKQIILGIILGGLIVWFLS